MTANVLIVVGAIVLGAVAVALAVSIPEITRERRAGRHAEKVRRIVADSRTTEQPSVPPLLPVPVRRDPPPAGTPPLAAELYQWEPVFDPTWLHDDTAALFADIRVTDGPLAIGDAVTVPARWADLESTQEWSLVGEVTG